MLTTAVLPDHESGAGVCQERSRYYAQQWMQSQIFPTFGILWAIIITMPVPDPLHPIRFYSFYMISHLFTTVILGGVAQMAERVLSMHEAQGSIPCSSKLFGVENQLFLHHLGLLLKQSGRCLICSCLDSADETVISPSRSKSWFRNIKLICGTVLFRIL